MTPIPVPGPADDAAITAEKQIVKTLYSLNHDYGVLVLKKTAKSRRATLSEDKANIMLNLLNDIIDREPSSELSPAVMTAMLLRTIIEDAFESVIRTRAVTDGIVIHKIFSDTLKKRLGISNDNITVRIDTFVGSTRTRKDKTNFMGVLQIDYTISITLESVIRAVRANSRNKKIMTAFRLAQSDSGNYYDMDTEDEATLKKKILDIQYFEIVHVQDIMSCKTILDEFNLKFVPTPKPKKKQ